MSGPRTYASRNTTKDERIKLHGIPQREKQLNDLRAVGKYEV